MSASTGTGTGKPVLTQTGTGTGTEDVVLAPGTGTWEDFWSEVGEAVLASGTGTSERGTGTSFSEGWRVEFFWKRGRNGRRAYFHYRRGGSRKRETRYGGSIAVACERHPKRVRAFLARTQWVPQNLPQEWKVWVRETKA